MNKLLYCLFALLTFTILIDPSNTILNAKWPLGICLSVLTCAKVLLRGKSNISMLYLIGLLILITIAFIPAAVTIFTSVDYDSEKFREYTASLLTLALLLWVVKETKIDVAPILFAGSIVLSIITIIMFFLYYIDSPIYGVLFEYLYENKALMGSERSINDSIVYMQIYYKTCATSIIALSCYWYRSLKEKSFKAKLRLSILTLIYLFGLLLTGTRANILLAISVILMGMLLFYIKGKRGQLTIAIFSIISIIGTMWWLFTGFDEPSNISKAGHLASYIDLFMTSPEILLFGQGAGTYFMSQSSGFVVLTELTYIELIRVMGIPIFMIFLIFVLLPFYLSEKNGQTDENKHFLIGYAAYLLIAATNPLIIGSTGTIVIVSAISHTIMSKRLNE